MPTNPLILFAFLITAACASIAIAILTLQTKQTVKLTKAHFQNPKETPLKEVLENAVFTAVIAICTSLACLTAAIPGYNLFHP